MATVKKARGRRSREPLGVRRVLSELLLGLPHYYSWVKLAHPWGLVCNGVVECSKHLADPALHAAIAIDPDMWGMTNASYCQSVYHKEDTRQTLRNAGGSMRAFHRVADAPEFTTEVCTMIKRHDVMLAGVSVHCAASWARRASEYAYTLHNETMRLGPRLQDEIRKELNSAKSWLECERRLSEAQYVSEYCDIMMGVTVERRVPERFDISLECLHAAELMGRREYCEVVSRGRHAFLVPA